MLYKTMLVFSLFLQLMTMNFVLGKWVYDQTDDEAYEDVRGKDWHEAKEWINFEMWLRIEVFVFMGSIASGIVYMSVRAFVPNANEITDTEDCFSERTDHLEAN